MDRSCLASGVLRDEDHGSPCRLDIYRHLRRYVLKGRKHRARETCSAVAGTGMASPFRDADDGLSDIGYYLA